MLINITGCGEIDFYTTSGDAVRDDVEHDILEKINSKEYILDIDYKGVRCTKTKKVIYKFILDLAQISISQKRCHK